MKIIVIGATGLIGKEIVKVLAPRHEVIKVGHRSGDLQVDITSKSSIEEMYTNVGRFDALVSAAGSAAFGMMEKLSDDDYMFGLRDKLMGSVGICIISVICVLSFVSGNSNDRFGINTACRYRSIARP